MTNDQKKERILREMKFTWQPFSHLYKRLINDSDNEDEIIFPLMDEMIDEGLIKREKGSDPNGELVVLTNKGDKINKNGGLLKSMLDSMTDGQKIHRLLEFMWTTDPNRFGWTPENLIPAFDGQIDENEIEYLLGELIDNMDVSDCRTKSGFEIGFISKSKAAYFGKKYLKNGNKELPPIKIEIGQIQNIDRSVINAPVSQSRDDFSLNKTNANTINPPTPAEIKHKPKTWTLSNILFVVLTGLVATIIGGLFLYYWPDIKLKFGW